jgi:L-iditol 2-dehydrogenase
MSQDVAIPDRSKTAVLRRISEIGFEDRPVGRPGPDDALIKVMAVGICGSDVHFYEHGRIGGRVVRFPHVLGHECAGVVVATGENVTRLKPGDRVAIEPGIACFRCENCKAGKYNICPEVQFLSAPPTDGALTEYLVHPAHLLHAIPDHLGFDAATLAEPFSVGLHAAERAGVKPGSAVLITGLGPIGQMALIAAQAFGAGTVIVSDIEPFRLELARKLGATHVVNVVESSLAEAVERAVGGRGVDIAMDTSGQPRVIEASIPLIKRGGKMLSIGFPNAERVPVDITGMIMKEIDYLTSYRFANTFPLAIRLLASGRFNTDLLLTDHYPLEQTREALERARVNKVGSMKVVVHPHSSSCSM